MIDEHDILKIFDFAVWHDSPYSIYITYGLGFTGFVYDMDLFFKGGPGLPGEAV